MFSLSPRPALTTNDPVEETMKILIIGAVILAGLEEVPLKNALVSTAAHEPRAAQKSVNGRLPT
jgi:hypothetical protein